MEDNKKIRSSFTITSETDRKLNDILKYFEETKNLKLNKSVIVEKCIADVHDDIFIRKEKKDFWKEYRYEKSKIIFS